MVDGAIAGRVIPAACALVLAFPCAAAQWSGKGEAGLAFADGNTESSTANARVAVARKSAHTEYTAGAAGLYVRTNGNTTARRWESDLQTRQNFYKANFWYLGVRYEKDRFSGFDYQGLVTSGVGRRLIDTDRTRLLLQLGTGYKFWNNLLNMTEDSPTQKEHDVTFVSSVEFQHAFTNTTTLRNKFGGELNSGNKFLQDEIGIAVKMTDRLALSLAYALRHNTDPADGFRKTDTLTTANLVYEIK